MNQAKELAHFVRNLQKSVLRDAKKDKKPIDTKKFFNIVNNKVRSLDNKNNKRKTSETENEKEDFFYRYLKDACDSENKAQKRGRGIDYTFFYEAVAAHAAEELKEEV